MHPKERAISELRLNQAVMKNMLGAPGKLGVIAKYLGSPIIRQGSNMFDVNYLDDPYELPDENDIPMVEDNVISNEGWFFDGLSRGMHIEIKYTHYDKKLTCDYKGFRVYTEVAGDLESYAPFPDWEDIIEKLYAQAVKKKKQIDKFEQENNQANAAKETKTFLQQLRLKWGI